MNPTAERIRERTATVVAAATAATRAAEEFIARRRRLRAAEGRRHSAADLQSMSDAHDALHSAHDALVDASGLDCDGLITDGTDVTDPNAGADNLPRRAAEAPNAYAKATARAAEVREVLQPSTDPDYDVSGHGAPADPYKIGLALRRALRDPNTTATSELPRDANGTPNPYSQEAIRRHQESRR